MYYTRRFSFVLVLLLQSSYLEPAEGSLVTYPGDLRIGLHCIWEHLASGSLLMNVNGYNACMKVVTFYYIRRTLHTLCFVLCAAAR
jgi:hypothetical protein